jgi:hypothetical protein
MTLAKLNYLTYAAGFGGSMDVHVQELGSGAWRDEGPHHSAEAGTVQEVGLAYMLVGLTKH